MSVLHQSNRRTVLLFPAGDQAVRVTTHRLLQDLGHEVLPATTPDEAMDLLRRMRADLLVITDSRSPSGGAETGGREIIKRLAELPTAQRPAEVAVFADEAEEAELHDLEGQDGGTRLHVFIKPFHVHGLLAVLRGMSGAAKPVIAAGRRQLA